MATHSEKQPQPVLSRAGIVTAIAVLSALCVKLGAGDVSAWLEAHSDPIAALVLAVAPTVSGLLARHYVTPTARPKDEDGKLLVPAGTLTATNAAVDLALAQVKAIDAGEMADALLLDGQDLRAASGITVHQTINYPEAERITPEPPEAAPVTS